MPFNAIVRSAGNVSDPCDPTSNLSEPTIKNWDGFGAKNLCLVNCKPERMVGF